MKFADAKVSDSGFLGCKIPGSLEISRKVSVVGEFLKSFIYKSFILYTNNYYQFENNQHINKIQQIQTSK